MISLMTFLQILFSNTDQDRTEQTDDRNRKRDKRVKAITLVDPLISTKKDSNTTQDQSDRNKAANNNVVHVKLHSNEYPCTLSIWRNAFTRAQGLRLIKVKVDSLST